MVVFRAQTGQQNKTTPPQQTQEEGPGLIWGFGGSLNGVAITQKMPSPLGNKSLPPSGPGPGGHAWAFSLASTVASRLASRYRGSRRMMRVMLTRKNIARRTAAGHGAGVGALGGGREGPRGRRPSRRVPEFAELLERFGAPPNEPLPR